jgi:prepilin-type processing-associated H-X9-DG protein
MGSSAAKGEAPKRGLIRQWQESRAGSIMRATRRAKSHRSVMHRGVGLVQAVISVSTVVTLITTIAIPALVGLRGRNLQAVCTTRIGQLTRAMLVYASDYDETPPFLGIGFSSLGNNKWYPSLDPDWTHGEFYYMDRESWLIPGPQMRANALNPDWSSIPGGPPRVQDGQLFPYTRSPDLYLCPEFERVPVGTPGMNNSPKSQNVFNYTRTVFGRKLLSNVFGDPNTHDMLEPGPIMKLGAVHAPARMYMMLDEQWDFHCAGNYNGSGALQMSGNWMGAETIHALAQDMIGSYHGAAGRTVATPILMPNQRGNVGYYDGHVELVRDPWPWRTVAEGYALLDLLSFLVEDPQRLAQVTGPLLQSIYAQRGVRITVEQLISLFLQ